MKSRTWYRHEKARKAAQSGAGGLPMPHADRNGKVTTEARAEYRACQERHHLLHPEYATAWERPTPDTARGVYDFVQDFIQLDTIHPDQGTAMQLITVALDCAVVSARYGHRAEERNVSPEELLHHVKRPFTKNLLTDAIMRRWSDHARLAREEGRAYAVTQMTQATVEQAWRDLLVQDIHLPRLWTLITDPALGRQNPLFRAQPPPPWKRGEIGAGYEIVLREGRDLQAFEARVQNDPVYQHSRVRHTWRLWIEGEDPPLVDIHAPICAERKYNEVVLGAESESVRAIQEAVRLRFSVDTFVSDYEQAVANFEMLTSTMKEKFPTRTPWESRTDEEKELHAARTKLQTFVWEFYSVYEQVRGLTNRTPIIQSGFYKVVNRRWQPAHFWPMAVTGKETGPFLPADAVEHAHTVRESLVATAELKDQPEMRRFLTQWLLDHVRHLAHLRNRWFFAPSGPRLDLPGGPQVQPLVSMDISASQTQIHSILLGIDEMEEDSKHRPHKVGLAERAWAAHLAENPAGRAASAAVEQTRALKVEQRLFWAQAKRLHPDIGGNAELMKALNVKHDEAVQEITQRWGGTVQKYGPLLIDYDGPGDKRLIDAMKNLWMVLGYGSSVLDILREQVKDPELYGKGWRMKPTLRSLLFGGGTWQAPDVKAINAILATVPGYQARKEFLDACRWLATEMMTKNPYAGATLTDPLDDMAFTWNRPLMGAATRRLDDWDIILVKPGQYLKEPCPQCGGKSTLRGARLRCNNWKKHRLVWNAEFLERSPDEHGNLYLDESKLRKMIAPCIIHVLDSLFSSLVMQELVKDGATTLAGLHDAWYVPEMIYREGRAPESGHVVLARAIERAGEPWLRALGPIYDWLRPRMWSEQMETAYAKWQARVARADWPHFLAVPNPAPPAAR